MERWVANTFVFRSHLYEVVDALPDEALILRLKGRVKIVGLCRL